MDEDRIFSKCAWRLIPFMALLFLVNFLDRVNVGFAALTMNRDLGFSPSVYGFGAGVLFIGYFLFQLPSNMILARIGARRWIFCIVLAWGALSMANAMVRDAASFYALRFLLGLAESGYYPGMIFYMTLWFPKAYRARFAANFLIGLPLAFVVGAPVSSLILEMDGVLSLHGWQWLFLLEGLPAFALAFAVPSMFPDGPEKADFLSPEEKRTIAARLAAEAPPVEQGALSAFADPRVLALALIYLADQSAAFGARLWLPQIVQGLGISNFTTGFVVAIPFVIAIFAMAAWGHSSDTRNERMWHVTIPLLLAALGLSLAAFAQSGLVVFLAMSLAVIAAPMFLGPFWGLNSFFLSGTAAAGGIALISAVGSLGGFFGPTVIGILKEESGSYAPGMWVLAAALVVSSLGAFVLGRSAGRRAKGIEETGKGQAMSVGISLLRPEKGP
jgi:MFS transporter, ACS family, tartrate transporter